MLAWAVPAWCGTAQASFGVQIQLNNGGAKGLSSGDPNGVNSGGYCINEVLSGETNAVVTVVCNSNQFVSIEARPGNPFLGTHGGAYRFFLGTDTLPTRSVFSSDNAVWFSDYGTPTSMRIFFTDGMQELTIIY